MALDLVAAVRIPARNRAGSPAGFVHAPDFFARLMDRTSLVIDGRPAPRIKPRAAKACARPAAVIETAEQAGDPVAMLPVLYRLLWFVPPRHRPFLRSPRCRGAFPT
ncbi:hypothetical protein ACTMSW_20130 [Micromonospora sp. BQ11]|uniref:hypothetical protein n=1 Tax=Micromonospora sp. BQ11 TaxID=3452212 RepID=UPI003F8BDBA3